MAAWWNEVCLGLCRIAFQWGSQCRVRSVGLAHENRVWTKFTRLGLAEAVSIVCGDSEV